MSPNLLTTPSQHAHSGQRDRNGLQRRELTFTAVNGDQLLGAGELIGFTAPPPTPGWQVIESLTVLDGGTGRCQFAEGTGQSHVENTFATAVSDGWIRHGKTDK